MTEITLQTKVSEMLKAYPELEDKLLEISPMFAKLKNPVLRNTIAKVATLRQVAEVVSVPPGELVGKLRQMVGLSEFYPAGDTHDCSCHSHRPEWAEASDSNEVFDVRPLLEQGHHPLHDVVARAEKLEADKVLQVVAGFKPVPLIETLTTKNFLVYGTEDGCFVKKK